MFITYEYKIVYIPPMECSTEEKQKRLNVEGVKGFKVIHAQPTPSGGIEFLLIKEQHNTYMIPEEES